ncbi:uncharacterized protein C19orf44-like [Saccostrea echinata]|uniref:uncharacterized protein C19orf44-like n=1 Tax=Saccostrea echinata TaxID=191078 RepID=UPI002A8153AB|nr:uncharacterized protein C19orf44-like [Saccostrea echinata]XP_061192484.1 uncharacterized protein C19orf44-like [Saccostrea echinata]XP_061192485.1 uncharacterized protein C19orf44-like [Saccostrea echinata]
MIKRGSTSALLQKAQSQLRGEKVSKATEEEDDLNAYIKSLTQKTTSHQQKKTVNFEDGEISISSDVDTHTQTSSSHAKKRPLITSGNKFLKKKQTEMTSQPSAKYLKKPQVSNASPVPTVSGDMVRTNKPRDSARSSSALSKASALSNKFAKRSAETRKVFTLETDSSESLQTPRPGSALGSYNERSRSADSDSMKIGKDGSKFMKKKTPAPEPQRNRSPSPQTNQRKQSPSSQQQAQRKRSPTPVGKAKDKKAPTRFSADVVLSSGEESLAEFMAGLDSSESFPGGKGKHKKGPRTPSPTIPRSPSPDSKPPTARRSPSPGPFRSPSPGPFRSRSPGPFRSHSPGDQRSPSPVPHKRGGRSPKLHRSHSSRSSSAESDILESEKYDESSDDAFRFNLMDIDALEPVLVDSDSKTKTKEISKAKSKTKKTEFKSQKSKPKKQKSEENDLFFGLQTVEDLLGGIPEERPPSVASEEVKTESEDIPEEIGPPKRKTTSFHSVLESEIKTQDFTSLRRSYSDDFDDTISERIGDSHRRLSRPSSRNTDIDDYTETFQSESEITEESGTATETEESEKPERQKPIKPAWEDKGRRLRTTEVGLQTEEPGLTYRFNVSPGFIDPASIASYVIGPDALEAMTTYSPCMLALHDMLKQQLDLTKSFLASQQNLYRSMSETLDHKYHYTTLEDTKKYIKKHRAKKLSMKEALKLVDLENQS